MAGSKLSVVLELTSDGIVQCTDDDDGAPLNPRLADLKTQIMALIEQEAVDRGPQPSASEIEAVEEEVDSGSSPEILSRLSPKRYSRPRVRLLSPPSEVDDDRIEPLTLMTTIATDDAVLDEETRQAMIEGKRCRRLQKTKTKPAIGNEHNLLAKDEWNAQEEEDGGDGEQDEDEDERGGSDNSSEVEERSDIVISMSGKSEGSISEESDRGSFTLGVSPLHGRARALSRQRQKKLAQTQGRDGAVYGV